MENENQTSLLPACLLIKSEDSDRQVFICHLVKIRAFYIFHIATRLLTPKPSKLFSIHNQ